MVTETVDRILAGFAEEIGSEGAVTCVGGRTQWDVGGMPAPGTREVCAPGGVVAFTPAEMTVRVRAGTTVAELDAALAEGGQMVPLDPAVPGRATVGGALAVGHSGVRRLRYGPIRDTVLEVRYVDALGRLVKAGGPVVKNVSGFDLCRLLVGSLGTLGVLAEVVLRAQPRPVTTMWLAGTGDPFEVRKRLFRPSSVLWDGTTTWVLLEGHPADVEAEGRLLGDAFTETGSPPPVPASGWRQSLPPDDLRNLTGEFLAEIGVGTVHRSGVPDPRARVELDPRTLDLNSRVKAVFDPAGRMNPGRSVVAW